VRAIVATLVLVLVLVIVARTASAQPGATEPIPPGDIEAPPVYAPPQQPFQQQQPYQQQQPQGPQKSEDIALWLSLGGTLGSYALLFTPLLFTTDSYSESESNSGMRELASAASSIGLVGTLLAPTFGHWYAGKGFTRGFGLRLGAIGVALIGVVVALSGCSLGFGHDQAEDPNCGQGEPIGIALLIGAGGMWVGGTVDDIVQAPRRVRRNNGAQIALTPLISGDRAGLALVGAF